MTVCSGCSTASQFFGDVIADNLLNKMISDIFADNLLNKMISDIFADNLLNAKTFCLQFAECKIFLLTIC
jgi:hypothetical protein